MSAEIMRIVFSFETKKCFQQLSNEKMGELLKENTETLLFDLTVMSLVGTPFGPIEAGFHSRY